VTYNDRDLIASLKSRDNRAFSHLYDNYNKALFRVIKKIIPDNEDASDVLQEVFINIYRKIDTYDGSKGRLFTWMLNISVNAAVDKARSAAYRRIKNTFSLDKLTENKIWVVASGIRDVGIKKTLDRLSAEQNELIHLSYYQGYTQEQISVMRGIPLGTVKSRIRIALKQLKQLLVAENSRVETYLT
jgi:RNA polymerase sigma-70 factor (ECF subfamily)